MASRPKASHQPGVRLVRKHHLLVRVSHWLNGLLLAGCDCGNNVTNHDFNLDATKETTQK